MTAEAAAAQLTSRRRLAVILGTVFLPVGTGHVLLGRPRRALGWALLLLALNLALLWSGVAGIVLLVAVGLLSMLDVARLLKRPQRRVPPLRWLVPAFLGWVLLAANVRGWVREALVEPWRVPAGSMSPTLEVGDHFMSDRRVAGERPLLAELLLPGRPLQRGEVIVFRAPGEAGKDFVKRVVALEGEVVALDDQGLLVDGQRPETKPLGPCTQPDESEAGRCELQEQVMGARRHRIVRVGGGASELGLSAARCPPATEPAGSGCRVLPGHVFVLGDNRDNSYDSRFWGAVPLADVKAAALYVHFSSSAHGGIRWERVGQPIH